MKRRWFKLIFISLITLLFVGGITGSIYYYIQYKNVKNEQVNKEKEIKKLVTQVGKLILLPQDESPTVATVIDKDKLKNEAFFQKSENQDKVLIYTKWQKAILYRPSINLIINVAPINSIETDEGTKEE
ncbi:MAG: hypothetical protein WCV58_00550 [Patescibacteria group bacterium]